MKKVLLSAQGLAWVRVARRSRSPVVLLLLAGLGVLTGRATAAVFEDFESYAVGSNLHGQGGWAGWADDPSAGALVATNFAFSPTRSVNITGASDLVHTFSGVTNGQWVLSLRQYIPSTSTGTNYVILMNKYRPPYGAADLSWSVIIQNNLAAGQVISELGGGATRPMVKDQWVEVRCEINLASDTVTEFYNGQLLSTHPWQGGPAPYRIEALDLWANNAGPVYHDNVSLGQDCGTNCCCAGCVAPYPASYIVNVLPGYNFLVNHLCHGTTNTLATVLPNVPPGTVVQKWNGVGFTTYTFDDVDLTWQPDGNATLNPGEGFILQNPGQAFTLTFEGCEPQCPPPCAPTNGVSLVGRLGIGTARWTNLFSCPPPCGARLSVWTGSAFTNYDYANNGWTPFEPVLAVGHSAYVSVVANTNCCLGVSNEHLTAAADGSGKLNYSFDLRNGAGVPVKYLFFVPDTNCFTSMPDVFIFNPPLPVGQTTNLSMMLNLTANCPTNLCFQLAAHDPNFVRCCSITRCVTPITGGPQLVSAVPICTSNKITVTFDRPLDPATALNPANYVVADLTHGLSLAIANVTFGPDQKTVCLFTAGPLTASTRYQLTVNNVKDTSGNVVSPDSKTTFCCPNPGNRLNWTFVNGQLCLSWFCDGVLECAASLNPPIQWTPAPSQASPQCVTPGGEKKFFRLRQ